MRLGSVSEKLGFRKKTEAQILKLGSKSGAEHPESGGI